jgi:CheY-like chemotaxis protein
MQKQEIPIAGQVVVVDDDRFVRDLTIHTIEYGINRKVTAFENGLTALQHVLKHPKQVDVIVADANIPDMDGFELLSELKSAHPKIAFILTTSNPLLEQKACRLKADAFLLKPFSIDDLFVLVKQFVMADKDHNGDNIKLFPKTSESDQSAVQ